MLLRSIKIWLILMFVESIHGTLRTLYLEPWLGSFRARQISVLTGCVMILLLTLLFIRWIGARTSKQLLVVGLVWVLLTLIFEFGLVGPVLQYTWQRMTEDYDLRHGGLMIFGLLFMLIAPYLAARLRGERQTAV